MYDVRHVLRKAGLRSTYSGYNYLASAVALVLKDQEFYMKNVTSNLYRVVGEQYGVSNMCVEAAIRTILSPLLGYPVFDKPTASEFISMLADYIQDHSPR